MADKTDYIGLWTQCYGLIVPTIQALANLQDATAELLVQKNPAMANKLALDAKALRTKLEQLQQAAESASQSSGKEAQP